jgi:Homeodomain-like domain
MTEEQVEKILRLHDRGKSVKEIAAVTGWSANYIYLILRRERLIGRGSLPSEPQFPRAGQLGPSQ